MNTGPLSRIPPAADHAAVTRVSHPMLKPSPHHLNGGQAGLPPVSESLLVVAWRGRWILLVCVLLSLTGGFIYVKTAAPNFTSTSKLYLDYVAVVPPLADLNRPPQMERYLYTQAGLLKSRPILAEAIRALEPQQLQTLRDKDTDAQVAFIGRKINVGVGRRDDIVTVSFTSPYPAEVAQIVNRVVEAYMTSRSVHEQRNAAQVFRILQDDLNRVNEELSQKEKQLEDFQVNHELLTLGADAGGGTVQRHLEELRVAFTRSQIDSMAAESFLKAVKTLADDPRALRQYVRVKGGVDGYAGVAAETTTLENNLRELDLQVQELSSKLTSAHPRVTALIAQRDQVRGQLAEVNANFVNAAMTAAAQSYADANDYETQIAAMYEKQQEQVGAVNVEMERYRQLRSAVDRLTQRAQDLGQQVQEIARIVNEDVGQLRMAILEPALPSTTPTSPQKGRTMALSLVLGVLLGGGLAVGRDWLNHAKRSAEDISALLDLPILGVIPSMSQRQRIQDRGRKVLLQPDSDEAEAFRSVRTAVFFGMPKHAARTLSVTSPAEGDGKSTLVSNLAIAIAHAGQKTIILDADLRKPMQHTIFEMNHKERCLSNVLAGRMKLSEAIQPTGIRNLHLLTHGHAASSSAETLSSPWFAALLQRLAKVYDRVIIDTPPVTDVTDAQIVGALCDVTILVLRTDRSAQRTAQRAVDALGRVHARLLGVVLNGACRKGDRHIGYFGRSSREHNPESPDDGKSNATSDMVRAEEGTAHVLHRLREE